MRVLPCFASTKRHAVGVEGAPLHLRSHNRARVPLAALRWRPPNGETDAKRDERVKELAADLARRGQKEPVDVWRAADGSLRVVSKNAMRLEALLRLPNTRDVEVRLLNAPPQAWRGDEEEYVPLLTSAHSKTTSKQEENPKKVERAYKKARAGMMKRTKIRCKVLRREGLAGLIVRARGLEALGLEGFIPLNELRRNRWRYWSQLEKGQRADAVDVAHDLHKLEGEELDACIIDFKMPPKISEEEGADSKEEQGSLILSERVYLTSQYIQKAEVGERGDAMVCRVVTKMENSTETEKSTARRCVFVDVGGLIRPFSKCGVEALLFAEDQEDLQILQEGDQVQVELSRLDAGKNRIRATLLNKVEDDNGCIRREELE
uniref:Uncharacterized protein n=1 Tax=Picocystis salinarum TaxID=88271 RepID=A0A7S3UFH5_9CHLO|mmetsp:Transcript_4046/g.25406  ORF Transcript_4046/g.25406 Transcript_4046/m.25406 type:complete len:377 (+) Transcript_4046:43-1173(+)|eukprot:CAMPEP_0183828220 /NCGR_PEP_ID=MMETSP0807_2-20130328/2671_1 /TAXON_ID=88271 /ORGANISM="Picocystis salinarum, Strain CCMP1897" /LENGTH=376 /DNA_ID=CAMNT_0026073407 /DNA_START=27 /DNA_END=1157 /DNA_ORIENTATION=-